MIRVSKSEFELIPLGLVLWGVGETRLLEVRSFGSVVTRTLLEGKCHEGGCCKEKLELLNGRTRRFLGEVVGVLGS